MLTPIQWPSRFVPHILLAGYFHLADRNFRFIHLMQDHSLHIYTYHGRCRLGQQEYEIHPNDFTFTPAGVPASYNLPEPGRHWIFRFSHLPADLPQSPMVSLPFHGSLGSRAPSVLTEVMHMVSLLTRPGASDHSHWVAEAGLLRLMLELALPAASMNPAPAVFPSRLTPASDACDQLQLRMSQQITIPQIVRIVGVSQRNLARNFRELYGMSMPRYLLVLRINKARHLLATTDLPVGTIAKEVGMPDITHFSRQFKLINGTSPNNFRCNMRNRYAE